MTEIPTASAVQIHDPPPLNHITTNITSLSSILRKFSEFAFQELSHIVSTQPNDEAKKKKLLELIVHLRNEFIRLYVLAKWSKSSSVEFTKLIDLLSYLREQTQYFTHLIWATQSLNESLLSAKLPNPDIVTSLEVLNLGEPILPTHNFIKRKELSNAKILKVLKDLNVLLSIKFAMVDDVPQVFLQNYEIKDGRITIRTKDYFFQLSILSEKSNFILIDFQFNTDEDSNNILHIPHCSKLRKVANEVLQRDGFQQLEKIFKNYNNTLKFYLIHQKLNKIKNIKHQYYPDKFLIILNYWVNSFVFKNSFIEIGLNKSNELIYRWYRSGTFVKTFKDIQDIEIFLQNIQFKHSSRILNKIYELYVNNSLLQLNPQTGLFYFKNPTPFLNSALKKLNLDDFKNINENLKQIKSSHRLLEISSILSVTNWKFNDALKLSHSDLKKILSSTNNEIQLSSAQLNHISKSVKFFQREEWPINWQLILAIDGNEIRAFMGTFTTSPQIANSSNNASGSSLKHFKELKIDTLEYKNSKSFINDVTEEFLIELISGELANTCFKHEEACVSVSSGPDLIKVEDETTVVKKRKKCGLFVIETKSFVRVLYCSELVYLQYEILENLSIKIQMFGKLYKSYERLGDLVNVIVDKTTGNWKIEETFQFGYDSNVKFLKSISLKLEKLSKILELIDILKSSPQISLISVTLNEIIFSYNSLENVITLKQSSQSGIKTIEFNDSNPHKLCQTSIESYLQSQGITKLIKYLINSITLFDNFKKIMSLVFQQNKVKELGKSINLEIIPKNLNNFDILYFNSITGQVIRLIVEIIQTTKPDIQSASSSRQEKFRFYIKVEANHEKDSAAFKEIFKFNPSSNNSTFGKGVILLNDALFCSGGSQLESCLDVLNRKILERFV